MLADRSSAELERHSRRISPPEPGAEGRARLASARVLVVGAGGLGAAAAGQLAVGGVGYLGIVDCGAVESAAPGGQLLHLASDAGRNKAESATARIAALNPEAQADAYPVRLEAANAEAIVAGHDLVVECSGHTETRCLVNDACLALGVALVWGEVAGSRGRVGAVQPGASACYRCTLPQLHSEAAELDADGAAALGSLAGVVGSIEAAESVKLLAGVGRPLTDRVLEVDALDLTFAERTTGRRDGCRACATLESSQEGMA